MSERNDVPPAPTKGVPVEIEGRVRYFRYSLGTLRKVRDEFGEKALKGEGVTGDKLVKLFWYGLVGDDPSLTIEQVEDMIDMEHMDEILAAMKKAMGKKATAEVVGPQVPSPAAPNASR